MSGKATVPAGFREGASQRELSEALRQVRKVANYVYTTIRDLSTNGTGGDQAIWTAEEALAMESSLVLQVKAQGKSADGVRYGAFEVAAMFQRGESGAASQLGATTDKMTPIRSDAGITLTLGVDADSKVFAKVNDGGLAAMTWKAWIEARRTG